MGKARKVGVIAVATLSLVLVGTPASAYSITGWQTNSGWNSIDGGHTYRQRYDATIKAVEAPSFARDIGVRGKGTYPGGTFEVPVITWDSFGAGQGVSGSYAFTAMKVYHGTH